LIASEFILHSDHEALKYIQGQHKLNSDGGPSTRSNNVQMIQNNQEIKSKVTNISHLVEKTQVDAPGFSSGFSPDFCYLIFQD